MLSKMEESMRESNKILDDMSKQMELDREERKKMLLSKHLPEIMRGNGKDLSTVMERLENLIMNNTGQNKAQDFSMAAEISLLYDLSVDGDIAVISEGIRSYLAAMSPASVTQFSAILHRQIAHNLSHFFKLPNLTGLLCHSFSKESLVSVGRLALHYRYHQFVAEGYKALYSKPPVIYLNDDIPAEEHNFFCQQLGLPLSSISVLPTIVYGSNKRATDLSQLKQIIDDDITASKTPVLLVISFDGSWPGQINEFVKFCEICKQHQIWLHLQGCEMSHLVLDSQINATLSENAFSVELDIPHWLGLTHLLPRITTVCCDNESVQSALSFEVTHQITSLATFPIWLMFHHFGSNRLCNVLKYPYSVTEKIREKLKQFTSIIFISKRFDISASIIVRYAGPNNSLTDSDVSDALAAGCNGFLRDTYTDNLNLWLYEALCNEVPGLKQWISTEEINSFGLCLNFSFLKMKCVINSQDVNIDTLLMSIEQQLNILDTTLKQTDTFHQLVLAKDNLKLISLTDWCGLGAVQYVPSQWVDTQHCLPAIARLEVNALNVQLINDLLAADSAFSGG